MGFCDEQQRTGFVVEQLPEVLGSHHLGPCCVPKLKLCFVLPVDSQWIMKYHCECRSSEAGHWILSFAHSLEQPGRKSVCLGELQHGC